MNPESNSAAVAAAAAKYEQRGYVVTLEPSPGILPLELQNYRPDFVAIRDDEKVAVEVKSRRSLGADSVLMRLAEQLRTVPGWRLDIVVTEESEGRPTPELMSDEEVQARLKAAETLATEVKDYAGALLLLWTAVEAVLQSHVQRMGDHRPLSPSHLAKLAYSLGMVDDEHMPAIEWLVRVRNEVVHGRKPTDIFESSYTRAKALADWVTAVRPDERTTS